MKRRLTAGVMAVLTATGIGILTAESASAAPGYIGPKTCYMKYNIGYDNKSKMVATAWPIATGRRYHLAFYENADPYNGTNWNNFYIYVSGTGWVLKQSDHPDDNNPEERYVDMPTNVTHSINAKWTNFRLGLPVGVGYCYGDRPVL